MKITTIYQEFKYILIGNSFCPPSRFISDLMFLSIRDMGFKAQREYSDLSYWCLFSQTRKNVLYSQAGFEFWSLTLKGLLSLNFGAIFFNYVFPNNGSLVLFK